MLFASQIGIAGSVIGAAGRFSGVRRVLAGLQEVHLRFGGEDQGHPAVANAASSPPSRSDDDARSADSDDGSGESCAGASCDDVAFASFGEADARAYSNPDLYRARAVERLRVQRRRRVVLVAIMSSVAAVLASALLVYVLTSGRGHRHEARVRLVACKHRACILAGERFRTVRRSAGAPRARLRAGKRALRHPPRTPQRGRWNRPPPHRAIRRRQRLRLLRPLRQLRHRLRRVHPRRLRLHRRLLRRKTRPVSERLLLRTRAGRHAAPVVRLEKTTRAASCARARLDVFPATRSVSWGRAFFTGRWLALGRLRASSA